ncbi:MAG TPA: FGGY family carbohydrate kinase [Clostridia bacterium]|jgi:xylulokinase|nr:MAG: Xylulose kinase [Firmicutes bacterium ADurb.Bin146]HOD93407.1 FGGY family carbohydrate kinase [Clostridia bacterium]HQM39694.1 FGGY family carbohydrate kinase [Clostridia bacterium]
MSKYLIGIDLGTTVCKCSIYDDTMKLVSQAGVEYSLIYLPDGHIEQDANLWWKLSKEVVVKALSGIKDKENVKAISVSSQSMAFVALDEYGNTMSNAISWLDERGHSELQRIKEEFGESDIYSRTGKWLYGAYVLPKLLWLQKNEPDFFLASKIAFPMDFLIYRLSGKHITDRTIASGTMMYNIVNNEWDQEILDKFKIDKDKLPEIKLSATVAGHIKEDVAKELGLSFDVVIVVGGQDQKCASIAAGINESVCTVSLGTAAAIEMLYDKPVMDPNMKIPVFSYLTDNHWVSETAIACAGAAAKWYQKTFASSYSYDQLDEMAITEYAKQNGIFFYPYLNSNDAFCGAFYGLGLDSDIKKTFMAVREGIAFEISMLIDEMKEEPGAKEFKRIVLFGGGSYSKLWCQLIADVCNTPVIVKDTSEMAAKGACIIAGVGAGIFENPFKTLNQDSDTLIYKPDTGNVKIYLEKKIAHQRLKKKMFN